MKDVYDLTNPQSNIWQLEQVNGENNCINNIMTVLKLPAGLDINLLDKVINKIIEKNDCLRLRFVKDNLTLRQYVSEYVYTPIKVYSFDCDDVDDFAEVYKNADLNLFTHPYEFCIATTLNSTLVFYKTHHILTDAWSIAQIAEQINVLYTKMSNGESLEDFSKPSYLSLLSREKNYLDSKRYDLDRNFWSDYVKSMKTSKLFNNSDVFSKSAKRFERIIDADLSSMISSLCEKNKISEYSFYLGVIALYFYKVFNVVDLVIGTPFLNRQKRLGELEALGVFISTLPMNISIDTNSSFLDICKNINANNLSVFKHSSFPYHEIQNLYNESHNTSTNLYDVGFSYQINTLKEDSGTSVWYFSGEQNNPITIHITEINRYAEIKYDYLTSCFSDKDIERMNDIVFHIIHQLVDNIELSVSDIDILSKDDRRLLTDFNSTGKLDVIDETVVDVFNEIVKSHGDKTALICDGETMSYKELDRLSDILANKLCSLSNTKGNPVALFLDKGFDTIVSILAVLKSGNFYVPILPDEEKNRCRFIIENSSPLCVLTHKGYGNRLNDIDVCVIDFTDLDFNVLSCKPVDVNICVDDIAYMIYTSGSTGNPKGTLVMHKNIISLMKSIEGDDVLRACDSDVSMSLLKYSFDASGIDIYTSLLLGGSLLLISKEDELNPEKVIDLMERYMVSRSFLIPTWIEHIAIQDDVLGSNLSSLRILGTGGESLKPQIVNKLCDKYRDLSVINLYGPTETTMFTTYKVVNFSDIERNSVNIGRPIPYTRALLLSSNGDVLPVGFKGELVIYEDEDSAKNIAKGYFKLDEQTDKRFVSFNNPISGKIVRGYKTGDLALINDDLELEFFGRNDDVVKVNGGYLVALNEVENRINDALGKGFVSYPIAVPFKNTKIIVLFLVKEDKSIPMGTIKKCINNNISFYMRPKKIIEIDAFPRNSSGKIDRKELLKFANDYLADQNTKIVPPSTKTQKDLCKIFKKFTNISEISIKDDFIDDLGIDSLMLTTIYSALDKYSLNIQDLYTNPNIKDLADFIDSNKASQSMVDLSNIDDAIALNNAKKFDLSTVLITGTTGYLGIHILHDLLLSNEVKKIYCVIRNKIQLSGLERLYGMIEYYYDSDVNLLDAISRKVTVVNGDISKENLGISSSLYSKIKSEVTTVINSAANVRHFVKPKRIRKDNVVSVDNLIKFCSDKISFAHISTLSIAGFKSAYTLNKVYDENTLYIKQDFGNNPYLVTKFEAEKNILLATRNLGLNAKIFRVGNIMPRISDGLFQQNYSQNVFLSSIKTLLDIAKIPEELYNLKIEFSPVDECSLSILKLLLADFSNNIYHILNNNEITIKELVDIFSSLGYSIKKCSFEEFVKELDNKADEYSKEYILNTNLNLYKQDLSLESLAKTGFYWHKTDVDYIKNLVKIIYNKW